MGPAESYRWLAYLSPRFWLMWGVLGILWCCLWLPFWLQRVLGSGVGLSLYVVHGSRRRVVHTNLNLCFSRLSLAQRRRLARRHFMAFGRGLFDIGMAWWSPWSRLGRSIRYVNREYYDRALEDNKKIILLVPHFMNLDVGVVVLSQERPIVSMYRFIKNTLFDRACYLGRTRFNLKLIERSQGFRPIVREMNNGSPFYFLPDQDLGHKHSIFVPFFGIPTATVPTLGRVAALTRALVIPVMTKQTSAGYEIVFYPPLEGFPSGDEMRDATAMNRQIERMIEDCPEQYFWVHKRFKTRPSGEKKIY